MAQFVAFAVFCARDEVTKNEEAKKRTNKPEHGEEHNKSKAYLQEPAAVRKHCGEARSCNSRYAVVVRSLWMSRGPLRPPYLFLRGHARACACDACWSEGLPLRRPCWVEGA